ncbi:DUF4838 domain-containing protein [candidate division KSB1 bacterium]|nr:DUF4838 domain-containing protein [candidate division KSB1 bacterium]
MLTKKLLIGLWLMSSFSFLAMAVAAAELAFDQLRRWTIVPDTTARPSEKFAAREFQRLFQELTGTQLPIASQPPKSTQNIYLGLEMARLSGASMPDLGEEGVWIQIQTDNLYLAGGRPRGVLYAVYEFFERYVGVRFLTFDHTYFPGNVGRLTLPCETYTYQPTFEFRWSYLGENKEHPEFATRLRINTVTTDENLGGMTGQKLINHSLHRQLPVARYGKEHPEYFALVRGERNLQVFGGGPEPCVTNPEVVDIVTEAVLQELAENPHLKNVSVSQNDNDAYCRCERCEAINQREGSPMGAHLVFVNEIARRVAEKYPAVKVGTLAYWYTRKPPLTIRPRENVQIQLANIECCTLHPINDPDCEKNRAFYIDFMGWSQISHQIYVWTYVTDFRYYDLPLPNLKVISPNLRFFAQNQVRGVFMQGNGGGTSGEMSDLRNYVMSRCLWNPELDGWQLVTEFCQLHYGQAAPVILDYLNFIHQNAEAQKVHPDCFATPQGLGLNREVALKMMTYFEQALVLAENAVIRDRVEKISLTAWRALLETSADLVVEDGLLRRKYPPAITGIVSQYIRLARKHHLTMPDERTPFDQFETVLLEKYQKGLPVAQIENEYWRITSLPNENGRVVEMLYKPTQRNLMGAYRTNFMYGTFEEWTEKAFDPNAEPHPFQASSTSNTITLQRELTGSAMYTRKIKLDGKKINCETEITHHAATPKSYQLIVHPEFDAGTTSNDYRVLSGYVKQGQKWVIFNQQLVNDQGPNAHLLVEAKAGGQFAFFNHAAQFGVLETYPAPKVERLRTWWVPDFSLFNLELVTVPVELKAGESFKLDYTFEYLEQAPE